MLLVAKRWKPGACLRLVWYQACCLRLVWYQAWYRNPAPPPHRVSRPRGTGSVGDSVGEGIPPLLLHSADGIETFVCAWGQGQ